MDDTSIDAISETLNKEVRANTITKFFDKTARLKPLSGPRASIYFKTVSVSQNPVYLGLGGEELEMPCITFTTRGCLPTSHPSIFSSVPDSIEQYTLIDLYALPSWKRPKRKSKTKFREEDKGFSLLLALQWNQTFQALL